MVRPFFFFSLSEPPTLPNDLCLVLSPPSLSSSLSLSFCSVPHTAVYLAGVFTFLLSQPLPGEDDWIGALG